MSLLGLAPTNRLEVQIRGGKVSVTVSSARICIKYKMQKKETFAHRSFAPPALNTRKCTSVFQLL